MVRSKKVVDEKVEKSDKKTTNSTKPTKAKKAVEKKPIKKRVSNNGSIIFQNLTGGNGHPEQVITVGSYKIHAGDSKEFVSGVGNALLKSPQIKSLIASNYLQVVNGK